MTSASTSRRPRCARASRSGSRRSATLLDDDRRLPRATSPCTTRSRLPSRDAAFVFEAAPEKLPLKQQIFAELEKPHRARHHPCQQFLRPALDRDRPPPQASRARRRHAFLEPTASGAAGRGDPDRMDQRRDVIAEDHGPVARRRAQPGACAPRHSRLHRQPAAACLEARGDRHARRRRRRRRDHRHRDQGRLRRAPCRARHLRADRPRRRST